MDSNIDNEYRALIEAIKYTSEIMTGLTIKLTQNDERITQLENQLSDHENFKLEINSKINLFDNKLNELNELIASLNINLNGDDSDKFSSYVVNNSKSKSKTNTRTHTHTHTKKTISEPTQTLLTKSKFGAVMNDKKKVEKMIENIIEKREGLNELQKIVNSKVDEINLDKIEKEYTVDKSNDNTILKNPPNIHRRKMNFSRI